MKLISKVSTPFPSGSYSQNNQHLGQGREKPHKAVTGHPDVPVSLAFSEKGPGLSGSFWGGDCLWVFVCLFV